QYIPKTRPPGNRGCLVSEPRFLAFIVRTAGSPVCVDLGPARPIRAAIAAWRREIGRYQRDKGGQIDGATGTLAKLGWFPIQTHLQDVDSLVISPDGPLCFVSFAALPGRAPGTYAIEDYAIHYTNSGRSLYRQLRRLEQPAGGGLLVCGDIRYQTRFAPPS